MSKYKVGDSVKVNPRVMCPDKPELSLAGWQGWVTEINLDDESVSLKLDSATMLAMSSDYIRESALGGFAWELMVLGIDEVSPAAPRDTPKQTDKTYDDIYAYHRWDYLSDEHPGIAALVGPLGDADIAVILGAWEGHLTANLRFPFDARLEESEYPGPVRVGTFVAIVGIEVVDNHYGILVAVRAKRETHVLPLCDFEAVDRLGVNYLPLRDYVVWFANK